MPEIQAIASASSVHEKFYSILLAAIVAWCFVLAEAWKEREPASFFILPVLVTVIVVGMAGHNSYTVAKAAGAPQKIVESAKPLGIRIGPTPFKQTAHLAGKPAGQASPNAC